MRFNFDHLVHFTGSPEEAKDALSELGLHVVDGGKHENGGTYNTLSYFDLSYIELIGLFDRSLAETPTEKYSLRDTFQKDHFANGLSRIALRSQNLEEEAKRFKSLGLEVYGPTPLSRKRPDGSVVSWKLLFAGNADDELELPFFIQWDESDEERRKDLKAQQTIAEHQRGDLTLAAVGFAVKNAEKTVEKWAAYLDLEKGESFTDESLNATGYELKLAGGDLVFYSPNGEGIVSETLAKRGEKPFIVDFSGGNQKEQFEVKDAIYRFV
ncbi:VOC family protein [Oceanobacillus jeddahense]|uniref:VOC family protein n=1 Tax=Oceanobacillus jeddahense TaxID=1462527 RepID=A0ABY5JTA9_9BACI|nr:VOC family protein [Oceanobacillus jeddahense]UUI03346.1 VOC family protein [Oceanobacillus jeddahense]